MQPLLRPEASLDRRLNNWSNGRFFSIKNTLYSGHTKYQDVAIVDSYEFGKMLLIDGCCQSAQIDEYVYHESLVHAALVAHPNPREVLILGGGEGATLREILRHPTIERVVMVDIDGELVDLCERYLSEWHCGSFDDPRVELVLEDGKQFINATTDKYDIVIIDICDALEEGSNSIYSESFYDKAKDRLTLSGLLVVQTEEFAQQPNSEHLRVFRNLKNSFRFVDSYRSFVPSFSSVWSFLVANNMRSIADIPQPTIDAILDARGVSESLRYYDGETHSHMFALSKDLREALGACNGR